jgi:GT2 family glycosyltransferase
MTNITMLAATRPRLLKQALDSIGDLSDATVYIRDAGMNREVKGIALQWAQDRYNARVFASNTPALGTGPARNTVIDATDFHFGRGDYLYLSDDDVYFLQPNWLSILSAAYDQAWEHGFRVLAAYGHPFNRPIAPSTRLECRWNVEEVYAVATQSMLMRWETFDEFGPFCYTPAGKVCQSEDVDFSNRIRAAGYKVGVISPALLVNTGISNSFGEHIPGWELVKSQCPEGILCE